MPRTKMALLLVFVSLAASTTAAAKTSAECLKHLGGTSYDVDCYGGLSKDIVRDSERVYKHLRDSMPVDSPNRKLIGAYMQAQVEAEKFCTLEKEAGTDWQPAPSTNSYNMWDARYSACVYETRKLQNERLHGLLKSHEDKD